MKLRLCDPDITARVSLANILDYALFSRRYRNSTDSNELHVFERFHAARLLLEAGFDAYLDVKVAADDVSSTIQPDACGVKNDRMMLVFCTVAQPDDSIWQAIRTINRSENGQAVILSSEELDRATTRKEVPEGLDRSKLRLETLGWFDDTLDEDFQRTLRLIELMVNETRMRMLAPLFQKSGVKKEYRAKINPKLVYHNLTALSEAGLVDEPLEGTYELSPFGKTVMAELIAFLEKTRRTLDHYKDKEVN